MKRISLLLILCCTIIVSCIPSLHPIFNDTNKILEDRIIGLWSSDGSGLKLNDINTEGDTAVDLDSINKDNDFESNFNFSNSGSWHFQRAAILSYNKQEKDGSNVNITLENQMSGKPDISLLKKGYSLDKVVELPFYILEYLDLSSADAQQEYMMVNLTTIENETYMDFSPMPEFHQTSRFSVNLIPAHTFAKLVIQDNKLIVKSFDSEFIENLIKNKRVRLKHERIDDSIVLTASTEELRAFIKKYGNDDRLFIDDEILYSNL